MNLQDIITRAHATAVAKGWHPAETDPNDADRFGALIALVHSELSEALEAYRLDGIGSWANESGKPEGVPSELADVVVRIADICGLYKIDLAAAVEEKLTYNESRPHRHGGKRL